MREIIYLKKHVSKIYVCINYKKNVFPKIISLVVENFLCLHYCPSFWILLWKMYFQYNFICLYMISCTSLACLSRWFISGRSISRDGPPLRRNCAFFRNCERDFSRRTGGNRESRAPGGFMNCPNNLLSVIFNGAQIESDLSTMPHCGWQASPAQAECAPWFESSRA